MADRRCRAATTETSSTIQALKSAMDALMSSHEYADLRVRMDRCHCMATLSHDVCSATGFDNWKRSVRQREIFASATRSEEAEWGISASP